VAKVGQNGQKQTPRIEMKKARVIGLFIVVSWDIIELFAAIRGFSSF
jgi:hypothetical protein